MGLRSSKIDVAKRHLADCMEAPDYPIHSCHATCDDLAYLLAEIESLLAIVGRFADMDTKNLNDLADENERLRINLRDYRQKHPCRHEIMCWAEEVAAKALARAKDGYGG